jgi:DNA-binding MarR family transcriptional regulator
LRSAKSESASKPVVAQSRTGRPRRSNVGAPTSFNAGGPLARELTTVKLVRLVDCMYRSAQLAFPRVSGLSDFQWRVVARVNELQPLSINELSALLQRDVAQVSRAVKGMVAAGLLHRATRKGGPGVLITPTALGRTVYGPLERLARKRNARLIAGLTTKEMQTLEHAIAVMMRNAQLQLKQEVSLERREREAPRKSKQR